MKKHKIRSFLYIAFLFFSCKKDTVEIKPLASLMIVNTVTGGVSAKLNNYSSGVSNNNSSPYALYPGNPDIYVWPTTDSLKPYFNAGKSTQINAGDLYSLFLCGTPLQPEGILLKENFQPITDSIAMIRFVNLSPNSTPVNVTLSTSTTVNEFTSVSYKQFTDFKSFPGKSAHSSYTFQVRSATNPSVVLATLAMTGGALASSVPRFKHVTIVFRGMVGGTPAPGITRVNHYATP